MEYALVFILTVLTVIFWSGKGSWLIAGYNTMNDKEKQKTDRKKLCRVMAYCLGSVDILIIISLILGEEAMENLENIFSAIVIFIVILTIVLGKRGGTDRIFCGRVRGAC